jgi:hypothetical protein
MDWERHATYTDRRFELILIFICSKVMAIVSKNRLSIRILEPGNMCITF